MHRLTHLLDPQLDRMPDLEDNRKSNLPEQQHNHQQMCLMNCPRWEPLNHRRSAPTDTTDHTEAKDAQTDLKATLNALKESGKSLMNSSNLIGMAAEIFSGGKPGKSAVLDTAKKLLGRNAPPAVQEMLDKVNDNPAIKGVMDKLGGPAAITGMLQKLGGPGAIKGIVEKVESGINFDHPDKNSPQSLEKSVQAYQKITKSLSAMSSLIEQTASILPLRPEQQAKVKQFTDSVKASEQSLSKVNQLLASATKTIRESTAPAKPVATAEKNRPSW